MSNDWIRIELKDNQKLLENSQTKKVIKGKKYQASTYFVGYHGKPYIGYFVIVMLNNKNREIERKVFWLNNFSGKKKQAKIIFQAKTEKIVLGYRINSETDFNSNCKFDLLTSEKIQLKKVNSNKLEYFHSLYDYPFPRFEELKLKEELLLEKNLIWIFGAHRSGTTWLASQLLSYKTHCINEPHVSSHLATREEGVTDRLVRRIDHMKNLHSYFFSSRYKETWKFYLRKMILNRIFAEVRDLSHKVILKEPGGVVGAPDIILDCLPNSKMIVLLRDGRDVLDSVRDARGKSGFMKKFGDTPITKKNRSTFIEFQSKVWTTYMENLLKTYSKYPKKLRCMVKYEDLLNNTAEELGKLYKFIDVDISDDELQKIVKKYNFKNIPEKDKGTGKFTRSATPGTWKKNFSNEEKEVMNDIMSETLLKLGYEL